MADLPPATPLKKTGSPPSRCHPLEVGAREPLLLPSSTVDWFGLVLAVTGVMISGGQQFCHTTGDLTLAVGLGDILFVAEYVLET